jgi:hypothetical protein
MIFAMHQIKLSSIVHHAGGSAWYEALQRRIAAEGLLLGSVTSEVGVGGDIRRSLTAVRREGDRFTLEKHGSVVSYGAYADALLITARADEQAPPNGQVMVTVMKDQYQLEQTGQWEASGHARHLQRCLHDPQRRRGRADLRGAVCRDHRQHHAAGLAHSVVQCLVRHCPQCLAARPRPFARGHEARRRPTAGRRQPPARSGGTGAAAACALLSAATRFEAALAAGPAPCRCR